MTEDEAYKVHIQYTFNAFCSTTLLWCGLYLLMAAALVVAGGYAYHNRDYA